MTIALPVDRFLATLRIVQREGEHLTYSWRSLCDTSPTIDATWVETLEDGPERAVRLEAFVSRFGRMQDAIAGKLIPHWLQALAELTASQIENLNRAERLGVIEDVERWLELRRLRNRLVHEYLEQPNDFAEGLRVARDDSPMLLDAYHRIREYAEQRMSIETDRLPIPASLAPLTGSRRALSSQI